jgi:hypothetical protein
MAATSTPPISMRSAIAFYEQHPNAVGATETKIAYNGPCSMNFRGRCSKCAVEFNGMLEVGESDRCGYYRPLICPVCELDWRFDDGAFSINSLIPVRVTPTDDTAFDASTIPLHVDRDAMDDSGQTV